MVKGAPRVWLLLVSLISRESGIQNAKWTRGEGAKNSQSLKLLLGPCFIWYASPTFQDSLATDRISRAGQPCPDAWGSHTGPTPSSSPQTAAALGGEQGEGTPRAQSATEVGTNEKQSPFQAPRGQEDTEGKLQRDPVFSGGLRGQGFRPLRRGPEGGRGALTAGRWPSSRLKHSQACKRPLKSLRTWWLTPQAYGKRRRVTACQAPSSQWVSSLRRAVDV